MANGYTYTVPDWDQNISLEQARKMTSKYQAEKETILAEEFKNRKILPVSDTFNREAFEGLLAQDACAGIRIYLGMDEESKVHIIAVGVTAENRDILPADQGQAKTATMSSGKISQEGQRCPDYCPPPPSL